MKMVHKIVCLLFVLCWFRIRGVVGARNSFPSSDDDQTMVDEFTDSSSIIEDLMATNDLAEAPSDVPIFTQGVCKDVVEKYNYKCEEHTVTTKDGFILSVQRIPSGLSSKNASKSKPPVLLQHGVLVDGISWMVIGRDSLAFYLADNGFDVWVVNTRGTQYSRRHKSLKPSQWKFWDWSIDELIEHDLTSTLEYVFMQTKQQIHLVGHSTGSMMALGALAHNIPAVQLVRSAGLLSPIAYLNHIFSKFSVLAANLFFTEARKFYGLPEFNPLKRAAAEISKLICTLPGVDCSLYLAAITGPNCCLNKTGIVNFLAHETQPTSTKVMIHLSQNIRGEGIRKFDYGPIQNMKRYGRPYPPKYNIRHIPNDFPIFLGYGGKDALADFIDVEFLLLDMKNHDQNKLIKNFQFNYAHADFILATNVVEKVYKPLVTFLKSH